MRRLLIGFAEDRNGGRNHLAYLAWLRCRELVDAGKRSMLPDAPTGEELKSLLPRPDFVQADKLLDPAFARLRAVADAWQAARFAFMTSRLKQGRHPDTDRDFWNGYIDGPAPTLPTKSVPGDYSERMMLRQRTVLLVFIGVPALAVGFSIWWWWLRARRRKLLQRKDAAEVYVRRLK
jgi:hypothetical protein